MGARRVKEPGKQTGRQTSREALTDPNTHAGMRVHTHTHQPEHKCRHTHVHTHRPQHTCRHAHVYTYTHSYMHTHRHTCRCTCAGRHTHICRHTGAHRHTCRHAHTYTHICRHMHAHTHAHIRNGRRQETVETRWSKGCPPSAFLRGCSTRCHPTPSPAHHHQGPAGRLHPGTLSAWPCWPRGWPKLPVPLGAQVTSRVATCANC